MTRGKKIATTVLIILAGVLLWFGYALWRLAFVTAPDAYAVWNTANLVNEYLDTHDGAWPRSWDDLRKTYAASGRSDLRQLDDYRSRVNVDWNADPRSLVASPESGDDGLPFRVIWLKNGSRVHWAGAEPNWLIWRHLQNRRANAGTTATSKPN